MIAGVEGTTIENRLHYIILHQCAKWPIYYFDIQLHDRYTVTVNQAKINMISHIYNIKYYKAVLQFLDDYY